MGEWFISFDSDFGGINSSYRNVPSLLHNVITSIVGAKNLSPIKCTG